MTAAGATAVESVLASLADATELLARQGAQLRRVVLLGAQTYSGPAQPRVREQHAALRDATAGWPEGAST